MLELWIGGVTGLIFSASVFFGATPWFFLTHLFQNFIRWTDDEESINFESFMEKVRNQHGWFKNTEQYWAADFEYKNSKTGKYSRKDDTLNNLHALSIVIAAAPFFMYVSLPVTLGIYTTAILCVSVAFLIRSFKRKVKKDREENLNSDGGE